VIGVTLMLDMFDSRAWALTLGTAGLVYGATGVFLLGVELDYVLLAGALALFGAVMITSPIVTRSVKDSA
jgi:hypothetical protein